ncbi:ribonuclease P protein component [Roseibium sp. RKSG952]|uniref:ribonuclease P protein component n=1 Tax=Roseibium sp. RKSG952 TaxID=2529384 RepID=UPI0012BCD115|nr:ribonuclease P protein component [Roseibium sp. RKSG952]MTH97051.1 ribonuclease P protein component [Roseibium sp. RKSG952]
MKTLKKRSEFLAVAKGGRVGRRAFVVQGLKTSPETPSRVGFTVTKKTGNSVARSRIRRRLKAAVEALAPAEIPVGADFVLVARENALTLPFEKLVLDLKSGMTLALDPKRKSGNRTPRSRKNAQSKPVLPQKEQG